MRKAVRLGWVAVTVVAAGFCALEFVGWSAERELHRRAERVVHAVKSAPPRRAEATVPSGASGNALDNMVKVAEFLRDRSIPEGNVFRGFDDAEDRAKLLAATTRLRPPLDVLRRAAGKPLTLSGDDVLKALREQEWVHEQFDPDFAGDPVLELLEYWEQVLRVQADPAIARDVSVAALGASRYYALVGGLALERAAVAIEIAERSLRALLRVARSSSAEWSELADAWERAGSLLVLRREDILRDPDLLAARLVLWRSPTKWADVATRESDRTLRGGARYLWDRRSAVLGEVRRVEAAQSAFATALLEQDDWVRQWEGIDRTIHDAGDWRVWFGVLWKGPSIMLAAARSRTTLAKVACNLLSLRATTGKMPSETVAAPHVDGEICRWSMRPIRYRAGRLWSENRDGKAQDPSREGGLDYHWTGYDVIWDLNDAPLSIAFESCVDELLVLGLDDDLDASDVARIAGSTGRAVSLDDVRALSIQLITELVRRALMDLDAPLASSGPIEPDRSTDDSLQRIDGEWRALGRIPRIGELVRLSNTQSGNLRAASVRAARK